MLIHRLKSSDRKYAATGARISFALCVATVTASLTRVAISSDFSPPIDYPGAAYTANPGISDDNRIVGLTKLNGVQTGFLYQDALFSEIQIPEVAPAPASDINSDGQIVGSYSVIGGGTHGYSFADGMFHTLDHPTGENTNLFGINNSGEIVGIYFELDPFRYRGFRYDGNAFHPIDFPGATHTFARGISNNGLIVGSYGDSSPEDHGFLFDGADYHPIDFPGAERTMASGVNSRGWVVGTYILAGGAGAHGFVLKDGEYESVNYPSNNDTTNLKDINDAGLAVGTFQTPDGLGPQHVFTFAVPEPSTVAMCGLVLLLAQIRLRR